MMIAVLYRVLFVWSTARAMPAHVSPHLASMCSLFAVLTRLHRPQRENYPEAVRDLVHDLAPLEKALLYSDGVVPDRLDGADARELRSLASALRDEFRHENWYEGRVGASVREMRTALMQAAVRDDST